MSALDKARAERAARDEAQAQADAKVLAELESPLLAALTAAAEASTKVRSARGRLAADKIVNALRNAADQLETPTA